MHSWYTVEEYVNNKFDLQIKFNNVTSDIILTLDSKNYTGSDLIAELSTQLNNIVDFTNKFAFIYDSSRHIILISCDFGYTFKILTKSDILTKIEGSWNGLNLSLIHI